jgi:hypothetical protein
LCPWIIQRASIHKKGIPSPEVTDTASLYVCGKSAQGMLSIIFLIFFSDVTKLLFGPHCRIIASAVNKARIEPSEEERREKS